MPPLSAFLGATDFTDLQIPLRAHDEAAAIRYGAFLQTVFNFLIIAVCIFVMVKVMNRLRRAMTPPPPPPAPPPPPPRSELLLEEIRDLLRERKDKE